MATYNASAYNDNHTLLAKIQNIEDYLEKNRVTVSTLCSRWATTIHEDAMLWVDDMYTPRKYKSGTKKLKGEWDGDAPTENNRKTKIGEW